MREIKFRAWDGKRMCKVEQWDFRKPMGLDIRGEDGKGTYTESSIPVMQFTGLLDKNGKEIYEGDIVAEKWVQKTIDKEGEHFNERVTNVTVVEYKFSGFEPFAFAHFGDEGVENEKVEVIGNIYENPKLDEQDEIQEDSTSMEEKLEALDEDEIISDDVFYDK